MRTCLLRTWLLTSPSLTPPQRRHGASPASGLAPGLKRQSRRRQNRRLQLLPRLTMKTSQLKLRLQERSVGGLAPLQEHMLLKRQWLLQKQHSQQNSQLPWQPWHPHFSRLPTCSCL